MNRYDPDFHDIDPVTHRPFSGGHPDGVWLIAIVLALSALALDGLATVELRKSSDDPSFQSSAIFGGVVAIVVLVPSIFLLFARKKLAAVLVGVAALIACYWAATSFLDAYQGDRLTIPVILGVTTVAGVAIAIGLYALGLVRQKLLT
jgi:hypothetical protein